MADKTESELAEGLEQDLGIRAMAEKLAPRGAYNAPQTSHLDYVPPPKVVQGGTVEHKLQEIERLVREIRAMSAQVKGMLG